MGKSKGGWTTKILALTDALGNLVRFILLPGNRYDTVGVAPLIKGLQFDALLGDKAYDSNWIIADMNSRVSAVSIPLPLSTRSETESPIKQRQN
ncbi:transposase [Lacimonas salitolerans]|uniref:Transposase n=1 Tax=Lacimonas salitolerans TaxID=1323750 RepID=A0ABW4ELQ1_9RHOB